MGRLFVSFLSTVACYFWIKYDEEIKDDISNPIGPLVLVTIIGYYVGSIIMNVYGTSVDTILICYCADYEVNTRNHR